MIKQAMDFPTDCNSNNKIFVETSNSTFWDLYPSGRVIRAEDYLKQIVEMLGELQDTENKKYRIFDESSYIIKIASFDLETDAQFAARQQRLREAGDREARRQTMEQQAASIIDAIPEHLKELVRIRIGGS